jgi:serine/threonine protein kinase
MRTQEPGRKADARGRALSEWEQQGLAPSAAEQLGIDDRGGMEKISRSGISAHGEAQRVTGQSGNPTPHVEGFTVLEFLGAGPSGQTWHARTRSGRDVALKLFSPRFSAQPGFLTRFEKETAPLLVLNHPHIVPLVERGRKGDLFYLATEYIPEGSLRKRAR